jgi:hypothetical protein
MENHNLFNNRIISLSVLSYHIFLHLKVRNAWNIGYLSHAFQKFTSSIKNKTRKYNFT